MAMMCFVDLMLDWSVCFAVLVADILDILAAEASGNEESGNFLLVCGILGMLHLLLAGKCVCGQLRSCAAYLILPVSQVCTPQEFQNGDSAGGSDKFVVARMSHTSLVFYFRSTVTPATLSGVL